MEEAKSNLIEALNLKGQAMINKYKQTKEDSDEIKNLLKELSKWVKKDDAKYTQINTSYQNLSNNKVDLKELKKSLDDQPTKEKYLEFTEVLKEFGWDHWAGYYFDLMLITFPLQYVPL